MILLDDKLISDDIIEKEFVCNLNACKGACCVQGEAGAPLEVDEAFILEEIYPVVEPYLTEKGRKSIKKHGKAVLDAKSEYETPLVNGNECAYVVFEEGKTMCGIEKAYLDGKTDFQKPISCHLYPIRVSVTPMYTALNYERWAICDEACTLGKELGVPIYKFLKGPLTRKYGEDFYKKLAEIGEAWGNAT